MDIDKERCKAYKNDIEFWDYNIKIIKDRIIFEDMNRNNSAYLHSN